MPRNSHNASIDEGAKPWSSKFKHGTNTHGQTWEDIFGTPEHPMLETKLKPLPIVDDRPTDAEDWLMEDKRAKESDSRKRDNGEHERRLPNEANEL